MIYQMILVDKGDDLCDHSKETLIDITQKQNWKCSKIDGELRYKCAFCGQTRDYKKLTETTKL